MWPCTQFYTPEGIILSDNWAKRFRPAIARYSAHFSQKRITMATKVLGKKDSSHCAVYKNVAAIFLSERVHSISFHLISDISVDQCHVEYTYKLLEMKLVKWNDTLDIRDLSLRPKISIIFQARSLMCAAPTLRLWLIFSGPVGILHVGSTSIAQLLLSTAQQN